MAAISHLTSYQPDLDRFRRGACDQIGDATLRYLCCNNCGSVGDFEWRSLCRHDCNVIQDAELQRICRAN